MKQNKKRFIIASFIIFILISSTLGLIIGGYGNSSGSSSYDYNGYKFRATNNGYITHIGNTPFGLSYDPRSLGGISLDSVSLGDLNSADKVYLSFNPNEVQGSIVSEFHSSITPFLRIPLVVVCSEDVEGCENLPIKTCEDAKENQKVIMILEDDNIGSDYDGKCLVIKGSRDSLLRVVDGVIWKLLGVM